MKKTIAAAMIASAVVISGCNVSPFSPSNRHRIKNSGEIGDTNSNQNGVMAEIMKLKSRMDVMAQDIENLQNGLINTNNRNFGVQIFQGEGGLAAGVVVVVALALLAVNYKIQSMKYKKTAEILGQQIKKRSSGADEEEIYAAALEGRVEKEVYRIMKG